jgi:FKBP-type peptidyl-prolyl cis-trans isomerase SlyD
MKIGSDKMVSLVYELRESNSEGRVIEALDESRPLSFIYGTGRLLPVFESNLNTLQAGDSFSFELSAEDAYGDRREEMIVNVPASIFHNEDGTLNEEICRIGNEVPMMDTNGNRLNGIVNEITDEHVRMDFNHPMAGVDLHFSGRILSVREATAEEIASTGSSCSSCGDHSHDGCSGCH